MGREKQEKLAPEGNKGGKRGRSLGLGVTATRAGSGPKSIEPLSTPWCGHTHHPCESWGLHVPEGEQQPSCAFDEPSASAHPCCWKAPPLRSSSSSCAALHLCHSPMTTLTRLSLYHPDSVQILLVRDPDGRALLTDSQTGRFI